MDIEVMATSAVKTSISMTAALTTYIAEKDKEPIWDGNVHVYSNSKKDLEHHKGRVPVQIKGKLVDKVNQDKITYSIRTKDLQSYLAEGGTIYFVVLIDRNIGDTKIFYVNLLPFEIIRLLEESKKQDTKNVILKPFPKINTDKVDIFFNFIRDRKYQQPTASTEKIFSLEDIVKQGSFKEINFGYTSSKISNDPFDYLFNNGIYIYAVTTLGTMYPVEHISQVEVASTEFSANVTIKGKIFYDSYRWEHWKTKEEFHFGKNVVMQINNELQETKFNVTISGTLTERINALEFYIDAIEAQNFFIGDIKVPLIIENPEELKLTDKIEHLGLLKKVKLAFENAGVKKDLNCDILTEQDENKIRFIIRAFVEYKEVTFNAEKDVFSSGYLTIANIRILITAQKQKSGAYILSNFFKSKLLIQKKDENGQFYNVSQCCILKKSDYQKVDNIDYEFVYNDIIQYPLKDEYENDIIYMLFDMLSAYDESNNSDLLELAVKISKWLVDKIPDNLICKMNYLQVKYRKSTLSVNDYAWLKEHIKNVETPKDQKLGCAILLDKFELCDFLFEDFTEDEKEYFSQYPIMNLWNYKINKME